LLRRNSSSNKYNSNNKITLTGNNLININVIKKRIRRRILLELVANNDCAAVQRPAVAEKTSVYTP
jgi:hypothetical protein